MEDTIKERIVVKKNLSSHSQGLRLSDGFKNNIESKVIELINQAVKRASGNGRKTLMEYDL